MTERPHGTPPSAWPLASRFPYSLPPHSLPRPHPLAVGPLTMKDTVPYLAETSFFVAATGGSPSSTVLMDAGWTRFLKFGSPDQVMVISP